MVVGTISSTASVTMQPSPTSMRTARWGKIIAGTTPVFQIGIAMTQGAVPSGGLSFLERREPEWTPKDMVAAKLATVTSALLPGSTTRKFVHQMSSAHGVTAVAAGSVVATQHNVSEQIARQQVVAVDGQSDVVSIGIPATTPYSVDSLANPLLVAAQALALTFARTRNMPVVRAGGVAIIHHAMPWKFDPVRHPSYIDFFEQVLDDIKDPTLALAKYGETYADDSWYRHLYRTGNAFHGAHPLLLWQACAPALAHLGGVIVVGGHVPSVKQLGFRPASTFQDALELAAEICDTARPTLTHLHAPPVLVTEVN